MNKNSKMQLSNVLLAVVSILLIAVILYIFSAHKQNDISFRNNKDGAYVVTGKVIEKRTSCGLERLLADGTVKQGEGLCDAGKGLTVGGLFISTGGGALRSGPQERISNITSIHAGDQVEVRYIQDEDGQASTNCGSCYARK